MRHEELSVGVITVDAIHLAPTATNVDLTGAITGNQTVGGDATFAGDLTMTKADAKADVHDLDVNGQLVVTEAATCLSTLHTNGAATLASAIIEGAAAIGTTLGVTGKTTLAATDVVGAVAVTGATGITGATTITGTLTQSGAGKTTLSGDVDAKVNGKKMTVHDLDVEGTLVLTENLTAATGSIVLTAGDLTVGGTINNATLTAILGPLIATPTITVGDAAADAITVTAQFKVGGVNLTAPISGLAYISDVSTGLAFSAAGLDSAVVSGGDGAILEIITKKLFYYVTSATGALSVTLTEATAETSYYLVFVLPNGQLAISGIITPFTA